MRVRDGVEFVRTAEVDWIQADGNYCKLSVRGAETRLRGTISEFEDKLGPAGFVRIHRSIIVNRESILRLEP